jgi:nitrite reductase (NO-forming)
MTGYTLLLPALAITLLSAIATPALAGGSHNHPAANGTASAPLDIVRSAIDLAPPVGRRGPKTIKVKQQEGPRPFCSIQSGRYRRSRAHEPSRQQ